MSLTPATTLTEEQCERIHAIAHREEADTGRRPLGEGTRDVLRTDEVPAGFTHWLWHDPDLQAYASHDQRSGTVELTATPAHPLAAHALLSALQQQIASADLWAHGDRAQARIAAAVAGLPLQRELLLMSRTLTDLPEGPGLPSGTSVRGFDPERDRDAWLRLNSVAFAALPDQGSMTAADLDSKLRQPWADLPGFLVAQSDGSIVGFHWTKRDPEAHIDGAESGEVYVLGVDPEVRGNGLARGLLQAGLEHLRDQGLARAHLFVDESNHAAVRLYLAAGFRQIDTDRQYHW